MEHFDISVPREIRDALEQGARDGGFPDLGDYVAALVRDHAQRRAWLTAALIEGEQSGIDDRSIEDIIAQGRKRAGL
ncbi:type II toxin-antitoxin system ParD family antitoxin [Sphingomonas sp. MMS12-HWE2-04]|uniref:ribbon-helix-helix domain-containing protein n=1 Tax=Sphingomonas sp. MMS12-HWE2-04 TaxID=3234199 RepID=UPI00384D3ACC